MDEMERKRARITSQDEEQVIAMRNNGRTFREISETLHIAISTCSLIVRSANVGKREPKKRGRKKSFLPDPHGLFVSQELDEECTLTLEQLSEKCKARFGVVFSRSTISRAVTDFHFSFKKLGFRQEMTETPKSIHEKEEYAAQFLTKFNKNPESFFFMDEIEFSVSMRRPFGESSQCQPETFPPPVIRTLIIRVMTLIGMPQGRPLDNVMTLEVIHSAPNAEICHSFMVKALRDLHARGISSGTIVLGDVPIHHSKPMSDLFPPSAPFSLMFMPSNSPFFNPVDYGFEIWKDTVRSAKAKNEDELRHAIASAIDQIGADAVVKCINHAKHNCELYAKGNHDVI